MISLPRTCEKCGNSMYHYGSCEKCPQPPSTDAAKDARIAELEKHNLTMASFWGAKVQGLEAQLAQVISDAEETAWRDEAIALRKRVAELEANNKASGAICDLALANTDSWKSHAEQAEAQLAEARARIDVLESAQIDYEAQLAEARKWNQDLLDLARETRPDDDRRAAEWGLAVFAELKKARSDLAEAKSALSAMGERCRLNDWANEQSRRELYEYQAQLDATAALSAPLEKSVTVLREALEPFANECDPDDRFWTDRDDNSEIQICGRSSDLTFGDFREARAALEQTAPGGHEGSA